MSCWMTWGKKGRQQAPGGVPVAVVLGAAENGLLEGWRRGALQTDFLRPLKTAALEHEPTAFNFNRGEALCAVALCVLEAFGAFAKTHQLSICQRQDASPAITKWWSLKSIKIQNKAVTLMLLMHIWWVWTPSTGSYHSQVMHEATSRAVKYGLGQ